MPRYNYPGYYPPSTRFMAPRPKSKFGHHGGVDSPAEAGTPVYAEYDGEVFRSGEIHGYGKAIVVKSKAADGSTFYELYGHLGPDSLPQRGDKVQAGKPILGAFIGSKQYVNSFKGADITGPHLHREIIHPGANIHPEEGFGPVSSDVTYRADPETFDINHPFFPNMPGAVPLPRPRPNIPEPTAVPSGENAGTPANTVDDDHWLASVLNPKPLTPDAPRAFPPGDFSNAPFFQEGRINPLYPTDSFRPQAPTDTFNDRFYYGAPDSPGRGGAPSPALPSLSPSIDQPALDNPFNPYRLQPFPPQLLPPSTSGSATRDSMLGDPNVETPLARLLRLTASEPATEPVTASDPSATLAADRAPVRFADPLAALSALVRLSAMRDGPG
jgi:murein DD-endopeptidase MepM/ murein hydrolase activator NlpD